MMRHDDMALPAGANADAARTARGAHFVLFDAADEPSLLAQAIPGLEWFVVGGAQALELDDFASLLLKGCMWLERHAVGGAVHCFGDFRVSLVPGWVELLRVAPASSPLWVHGPRHTQSPPGLGTGPPKAGAGGDWGLESPAKGRDRPGLET